MLVRLTGDRVVNLAHLSWAEPVDQPGEALRVYVVGNLVRDLDRPDADRLRRRFKDLDPEPLPGDPAEGPARVEVTDRAEVRETAAKSSRRRRKAP